MNCKEKLLEVRDIHKVYTKEGVPTKALNGITFDVLDGEFLGIMGASGSGKTTLLNCIATVIKPTSGQVLLSGANVSSFDSEKLAEYIHELAHHLRMQEGYVNEQQLKVANYESYIENWVHEIKKPLSLMTLLLDNRKDEMSPLVHTRMLYVRDHTRQNVEQILYFSRLGAVHKDYYFEPLPILETCKEAVEDNLSLLEEAHFSVTYSGNNCTAISDKKGFMFILGQIISNSVKYAAHDATPAIHFSVSDNKEIGQIVLSICDNGTGIPASDLPFVFDKGFTGDVGSYLSRSTGMGLYLVQQMASDLTIKIDIHSNTNGGTTVILTFPKVERPLGR